MKVEPFSLHILRFYDKDDLPTCAINFAVGQYCHFYGTKTFGTKEVCMYHSQTLSRRGDGYGSLIPLDNCPLWSQHDTTS
jgi:hypothetical protein